MRIFLCLLSMLFHVTCLNVLCRADEIRDDTHDVVINEPDAVRIVPQDAIEAAIGGRFEDALPAYRKNVELQPSNVDARIHLGLILKMAGQYNEAIEELRTGVRLDPDSAEAHSALGLVLLDSGQLDEGIDELRVAVQIQPRNAKYVCDLAVGLGMAGQCEEGIEEFKQAIRLDPNFSDAYTNLGLAYAHLGRHPDAIQSLTDSLAVKETARARMGRAVAFQRNGQFAAAIEDYDSVLRHDPENHRAYACRAFANMRNGNFDAAIRDAERTLATGDKLSDVAYFVMGGVAFVRDDLDAAIANLDKAVRLHPEQPLHFVLRAVVRLKMVALADAVTDLESAIRVAGSPEQLNYHLDGFGWQVYKLRGHIKAQYLGTPNAAVADFTQAIELNEVDADGYVLRAWAYMRLSDWERALADLNKALAVAPDHHLASFLLVTVLTGCPKVEIRDGRRAIQLAKHACEQTEWKHPEHIQGLAAAYSEIGDFVGAAALQSKVVEVLQRSENGVGYPIKIWWNCEDRMELSINKKRSTDLFEHYKMGKPYRISSRVVQQ